MSEIGKFVDQTLEQIEISPGTLSVLRDTHAVGIDLRSLLEDPEGSAKKARLDLRDSERRDIKRLHETLTKMTKAEAGAVDLMAAVASDGRHFHRWLVEPASVAKELGVDISDETKELILRERQRMIDMSIGNSRGGETHSVAVGIIITVGTVLMTSGVAEQPTVIDRSRGWKP